MSRKLAISLLIITGVLWSTGGLLIKLIPWSPISIAGIRSGLSALIIYLYSKTYSKGFGRNILESMALGKAVIATETGGLRDVIVNGKNGFLVPIKDDISLSDKLNILIRDRELRKEIAINARNTVLEQFSIEDKIKKLNGLFYEM